MPNFWPGEGVEADPRGNDGVILAAARQGLQRDARAGLAVEA
jgi:hypothetical protein